MDAFRCWAWCITHLRDYYEDDFLVTHILSSLTGDASDVYDWVVRSIREPGGHVDVGLLFAKLREHYCGSLTFREQQNRVENLGQGEKEDDTDFLIRVSCAVDTLVKEFTDSISHKEASSLQYDVFLNGVRPEIRHVLDSKIAAHGRLTSDLMYDCVKRYETYVARGKRLGANSPYTGQQRAAHSRFPKTTAFTAAVGKIPEATSEVEGGLNVRMVVAMQEHERQKRKCFICQSTEHLMQDCLNQKNSHCQRGLPKPSQHRRRPSPLCPHSLRPRNRGMFCNCALPQSRPFPQMDWS